MTSAYVNLDRRFHELKAGQKIEPGWSTAFSDLAEYGMDWTQLLQHPRVVILAEAGTGKTAELKARASILRAAGEEAFYVRLESLLDSKLSEAMDGEESRTRLQAWLQGGGEATFLLDSVDEAKLQSKEGFTKALNHFRTGLGKALSRGRIIVTSRPSPDWNDETDRAAFHDILPPPERSGALGLMSHSANADAAVPTAAERDPKDRIGPLIAGLLPLESSRNARLAASLQVNDLDAFLAAAADANASEFLGRPADVIDLLELWKERGALGPLHAIIDATIDRRLRQDPKRPEAKPLTLDRSRRAAETLAAALILSRHGTVAGWNTSPETSEGSIDPQYCLPDWAVLDINALLVRPLFEMESFGQLRFARRSFREYLFARWMQRLLDGGAPLQSILALIIGQKYGVTAILPYAADSAAWLAQLDDRVREAVIKIDPMLLLRAGDPSLLPLDVRIRLLNEYVEKYAVRPDAHLSVDIQMVQRLVSPELGPLVASHLDSQCDNKPIRELMLRLAWQGNLREVLPTAIRMALDSTGDKYQRTLAIRCIDVAREEEYLKRLAVALVRKPADFGPSVGGEAIAVLFPDHLSPSELAAVLKVLDPPERFTVGLNYTLEQTIKKIASGPPTQALFKALMPLVVAPPHIEAPLAPISSRYGWILGSLSELIVRELVASTKPTDIVLRAVELLCQGSEFDMDTRNDVAALHKAINANRTLSLELFWRAVARAKKRSAKTGGQLSDFWHVHEYGEAWSLTADDVPALIEAVRSGKDAIDREVALTAAFAYLLDRSGTSPTLAQLRAAVQGQPALEAKLAAMETPAPKSSQQLEFERESANRKLTRKVREENERKQQEAFFAEMKSRTDLLAQADRSATEEGFRDLIRITQWLLEHSRNVSRYATLNIGKGRAAFGDATMDAYLLGIRSYWRRYSTALRSEGGAGNQTTYGSIVALAGVSAEAAANPAWPNGLTSEEAVLAVRHALVELSGFPEWFDKLIGGFPNEAQGIVRQEIAWEWSFEDENVPYYVLADLTYASEGVREIFAPDILNLLQTGMPKHRESLNRALQIICTSGLRNDPLFASLCQRETHAAVTPEDKAKWLSAWLIVDTSPALTWLSQEVGRLDQKDGDALVSLLLSDLFEAHGRDLAQIRAVRESDADQIVQLVRLSYRHIRPDEDVEHDGVYSPGVRDRAEDARRYFLERLTEIPTERAYALLLCMAKEKITFPGHLREYFVDRALVRAALDAEPARWTAEELPVFVDKFERSPATMAALMALILGRLEDIGYYLDNGDFSERDTVHAMTQEMQAQRWLASKLREAARGMYNVTREEEVISRKETDIRIHHPAAGALTVEIKLADKWGFDDLHAGYSKQLIGQYLRDRRGQAGIYLLIHRGITRKTWTIGKSRRASFADVVGAIGKKTRIPEGRLVQIVTYDVSTSNSVGPRRPVRRKSVAKRDARKTSAKRPR